MSSCSFVTLQVQWIGFIFFLKPLDRSHNIVLKPDRISYAQQLSGLVWFGWPRQKFSFVWFDLQTIINFGLVWFGLVWLPQFQLCIIGLKELLLESPAVVIPALCGIACSHLTRKLGRMPPRRSCSQESGWVQTRDLEVRIGLMVTWPSSSLH